LQHYEHSACQYTLMECDLGQVLGSSSMNVPKGLGTIKPLISNLPLLSLLQMKASSHFLDGKIPYSQGNGKSASRTSVHRRLSKLCCHVAGKKSNFSISRNLFELEGLCIQEFDPLYTSRSPSQVASGRFSPAALLKNLETYSGLTMYGLWDTNTLSVSISPPDSFTFAIISSWAWTGIARSSSQTR
jgi:hypothetical protein